MNPEVTTPEASTEQWAILEIMGHERLAGRISDATVAGVPMLRVEVPATDKLPGFTRLLSGASLFSVTPVPEAAARVVAARLAKNPVGELYSYSLADRQQLTQTLGLPAPGAPLPAELDEDEDGQDDERYDRPL